MPLTHQHYQTVVFSEQVKEAPFPRHPFQICIFVPPSLTFKYYQNHSQIFQWAEIGLNLVIFQTGLPVMLPVGVAICGENGRGIVPVLNKVMGSGTVPDLTPRGRLRSATQTHAPVLIIHTLISSSIICNLNPCPQVNLIIHCRFDY